MAIPRLHRRRAERRAIHPARTADRPRRLGSNPRRRNTPAKQEKRPRAPSIAPGIPPGEPLVFTLSVGSDSFGFPQVAWFSRAQRIDCGSIGPCSIAREIRPGEPLDFTLSGGSDNSGWRSRSPGDICVLGRRDRRRGPGTRWHGRSTASVRGGCGSDGSGASIGRGWRCGGPEARAGDCWRCRGSEARTWADRRCGGRPDDRHPRPGDHRPALSRDQGFAAHPAVPRSHAVRGAGCQRTGRVGRVGVKPSCPFNIRPPSAVSRR